MHLDKSWHSMASCSVHLWAKCLILSALPHPDVERRQPSRALSLSERYRLYSALMFVGLFFWLFAFSCWKAGSDTRDIVWWKERNTRQNKDVVIFSSLEEIHFVKRITSGNWTIINPITPPKNSEKHNLRTKASTGDNFDLVTNCSKHWDGIFNFTRMQA